MESSKDVKSNKAAQSEKMRFIPFSIRLSGPFGSTHLARYKSAFTSSCGYGIGVISLSTLKDS